MYIEWQSTAHMVLSLTSFEFVHESSVLCIDKTLWFCASYATKHYVQYCSSTGTCTGTKDNSLATGDSQTCSSYYLPHCCDQFFVRIFNNTQININQITVTITAK